MALRQSLLSVFICSILSVVLGHSQPLHQIVEECTIVLSRRGEVSIPQINSLVDNMIALDSTLWCDVLSELKVTGSGKHSQFALRRKVLEGVMKLHGFGCPDAPSTSRILLDCLQEAYRQGDDILAYLLHSSLAIAYTQTADFDSATMHTMIAKDLGTTAGKEDIRFDRYDWYLLAYSLYHSREYEASIDALMNTLRMTVIDSGHTDQTNRQLNQMYAWNTLGLCYSKLDKPDSAFIAYDHALTIADSINAPFWIGLIKGNQGEVYFQLAQYDTAEILIKEDYQESMMSEQYYNAANSLQWLARIDLHKGKPQEALTKLREAMRLLQVNPQVNNLVNTLYAFTQVFTRIGNADSVNYYMQRYLTLHDSLEREAHDNRFEIVKMRLENQHQLQEIVVLNKEKHRITMIRNFSIAVILLLAVIGFLILNRAKLRLKIKQQVALQDKRRADADAAHAREQLLIFTHNLREKSSLIESLQDQLLHKSMNDEQNQRISELSHYAILTDEDWDRFKQLFEKVYPGFFHHLKAKFSDITLAEQRMAALSKLRLSIKEAAALLGISPNSVHKSRYRLKHRLGLESDEDLEAYFSGDDTQSKRTDNQ